MNSGDVLYSKGENDECYTPGYAVKPILKYIPKQDIVWCPFDKKDSLFVRLIEQNNKVVFSHILTGQNFFVYEPVMWDCIVSNPPFGNKKKFFQRALSFNKPFAMLMTNTWLNDATPKRLFKDRDLQLLMFDKRIKYINTKNQFIGNPTFSSSYFCWNFLPKQIIMEDLDVDYHIDQINLFEK